MLDIKDRSRKPELAEIEEYIDNPLFAALRDEMERVHRALLSVEYSGDKQLEGWNLRFRRGGKTLVRLYPAPGRFKLLVVVGRKERERVEALLQRMCARLRGVYESTPEGMGQRWLLIELKDADELYNDVLSLIAIRRESK